MKLPAIQFYPGDWLRDEIAGCSLEAQGLWLRMMFLMHDSTRYGYLSTPDGAPSTPESIARRCGCSPAQFSTLLRELDAAGVPSRTEAGVIFSRRMVRDAAARAKNAQRQRAHYHREQNPPRLVKPNGGSDAEPNAEPNADLTATSQTSSSSSSSSSSETPPTPPERGGARARAGQHSATQGGEVDEEFLDWLAQQPAYVGVRVRNVYAKLAARCAVEGVRVERTRLLDWCNREFPEAERGGAREGMSYEQRYAEYQSRRQAGRGN